jgi:hypothetical protein
MEVKKQDLILIIGEQTVRMRLLEDELEKTQNALSEEILENETLKRNETLRKEGENNDG